MTDFQQHGGEGSDGARSGRARSGGGVSLTIVDATRAEGSGGLAEAALAWLSEAGGRAVGLLNVGGEVRVRVVEDAEMAAAHLEYAEVEGTTDVLTFDMSDRDENPEVPERNLGRLCTVYERELFCVDTDILICFDEAVRQAARRGYPVEKELLLYIVHGVLHCLGWDDHDDEASEAMHAVEDEVLVKIGVGPVYGVEPAEGA